MPKAVGRVKADLQRIALLGANGVRPIANLDTHHFYTFLSFSGSSGQLGLRKENAEVKRGHPLFLNISEPQRQERRFGVEEKSGDNWVKQIRWIRLVGLSPAGWRTW